MIRAILFDCNGIIADDEPIHMRLFQKVLKEEGVTLTKEEYFKKYLAMDDKACFREALKAGGKKPAKSYVRSLIARKAKYYKSVIKKELKIFEGVRSFVKHHHGKYPMIVVSGALRHEIQLILKRGKINRYFRGIVSSEDVKNGKPDAECYKKGLALLKRLPAFKKKPLQPSECVAIEDSIHGVESAQAAGMKCVAVTNSYSKAKLAHADLVVRSLKGLRIDKNLAA